MTNTISFDTQFFNLMKSGVPKEDMIIPYVQAEADQKLYHRVMKVNNFERIKVVYDDAQDKIYLKRIAEDQQPKHAFVCSSIAYFEKMIYDNPKLQNVQCISYEIIDKVNLRNTLGVKITRTSFGKGLEIAHYPLELAYVNKKKALNEIANLLEELCIFVDEVPMEDDEDDLFGDMLVRHTKYLKKLKELTEKHGGESDQVNAFLKQAGTVEKLRSEKKLKPETLALYDDFLL